MSAKGKQQRCCDSQRAGPALAQVIIKVMVPLTAYLFPFSLIDWEGEMICTEICLLLFQGLTFDQFQHPLLIQFV